KAVRADLVEQADPPPLVVEIEENPAVGGADHRQGGAQLIPAVAAERAENVAGETFRMKADKDGFGAVELATRERDDLGAVETEGIAAALDSSEVASCVRDEVARRPRVLLERMTSDVAQALLGRFGRVTEARVKVEKPEPDGLDAAAEAVELTLARGPRSS